ncbi:unnamed protein product [Pleuronectes platessa]|uniref:Uncharacterized protein n=1 Tax=Pleuronectes platessa TaxID=8262 RepID=A0A9N7TKQ9_PLEPL|nr:unnamed protein product [Pleuronectes platessa]
MRLNTRGRFGKNRTQVKHVGREGIYRGQKQEVKNATLCPSKRDSGTDPRRLCGVDKVSRLELSGPNEASLPAHENTSVLDLRTHQASVIAHIRVERHSERSQRTGAQSPA